MLFSFFCVTQNKIILQNVQDALVYMNVDGDCQTPKSS